MRLWIYLDGCLGYFEGGIWCIVQEVLNLPKALIEVGLEDCPQLLLPSTDETQQIKYGIGTSHASLMGLG